MGGEVIAPTEVKVLSAYETKGKQSGKPHMKLDLSDGSKLLEFDAGRFDFFREAQGNGRFVRIERWKSDKGYTSVNSAEYVPLPNEPPGKHFLGAGGAPAGTPGTPANPGPGADPSGENDSGAAASGGGPSPVADQEGQLCRVFCCLAAALVAWGGRFVLSEDKLWEMVGKMRHFVKTDQLPGEKKPAAPASAGTGMTPPGVGAGDRLPNYDEDL